MQKSTQQFRDLYVVATNGDTESSVIKLRQAVSGEAVPERLVLRLDDGKPRQDGSPQINLNNNDYKVFGGHRTDWIEDKLAGFRAKVGEVVCIQVRVLPSNVPTAKDMEAVERF